MWSVLYRLRTDDGGFVTNTIVKELKHSAFHLPPEQDILKVRDSPNLITVQYQSEYLILNVSMYNRTM